MQHSILLQSSFNSKCSIKVAFHTFANLHMACILINFQGHPVYFLAKVFSTEKIDKKESRHSNLYDDERL